MLTEIFDLQSWRGRLPTTADVVQLIAAWAAVSIPAACTASGSSTSTR